MKNKILFVATSDIHINTFHLPYLEWLFQQGHEIHLAVENRGDLQIPFIAKLIKIEFPRSPFSLGNIVAYRKLKKLMDKEQYDLIHCHTPVPSALSRLAGIKSRKKGTKLLYTAHGFHFYKGSPLKNWLTYYSMEYALSALTDVIITINKEDFEYVKDKMWHKESYQIKGIGINSKKFKTISEAQNKVVRTKLGYTEEDFILLYIAEFIPRKNHIFLLEAMPKLLEKCPNVKLVFAGKGILLEAMKRKTKELMIQDSVEFLGFRSDVEVLSSIADIGVSSSIHEGLGLGLAEEMLCSVPIVATVDRGHKEMVVNGFNGYLFEQGNYKDYIKYISMIYEDPALQRRLGENAFIKSQEFLIENSLASMIKIYQKHLKH